MSNPLPSTPPARPAAISFDAPSSTWDRITSWVSENKVLVSTVAGVAIVVTGAGAVFYLNSNPKPTPDSSPKLSKKERRKRKEAERKAAEIKEPSLVTSLPESVTVESDDELPEINETTVKDFTIEQREQYAAKLKQAGNRAYGDKAYNKAIALYSQAILCKPDPVFYSNRAACYNTMSEWDKVVEDTTAAINMDPEYVKAINRRAAAYEHQKKYSEALLDFTASCIIDNFKSESTAQAVERLLKVFAEHRAKEMMASRPAKLPSPIFVGNYLQSFRQKPRPAGLEESAAELDPETGKGQLQIGLRGLEKKTSEGYEIAWHAFDKALELGGLDEHEALAYNLRGTMRTLLGNHAEATEDFDKSITLDSGMIQSYIKRASINLELGQLDKAANDFDLALKQNKDDPDIYYHRAQASFIKGDLAEAQKDYQKSIDLDKDFIFSHIQLGVTQYKMGSIASSMATFRRCIKNFPKVPDVYNYYGELLLDQSNFSEAVEKFETAMEIEKQTKPMSMNVLPLINKALAIFQWKQKFDEAEELCQSALIIDPECDIAVATMAQLLLQQNKVTEALKYFERAAELARTEGEIVNALSYAEATRTQMQVTEKYPKLASKLAGGGGGGGPPGLGMGR